MDFESAHGGRAGRSADDDLRRGWVADLPSDADVTKVLALALSHAVAGVGGLGGLVHLAGREPGSLDLAAAIGLPPDLIEEWDHLTDNAAPGLAPARAVATGRPFWSQARPHAAARTWKHPRGVLSVPLIAGGAPIGALSVLADREPPQDRTDYLREMAGLVGERLGGARRWRSAETRWWEIGADETPAARRMMRSVQAGRWSRDLATDLIDTDDTTDGLLIKAGIDPHGWDHHMQTWLAHVHPADRDQVLRESARAQREEAPYVVEYRVQDSSGRLSWLLVCGWWEHDDTGRTVRITGYAWDITDRRSSETWLAALTDSYPLPTYVITADNRVTWANAVAREVAARQRADIVGRALWEVFPSLREQGAPDLLAAARAAPGRPAVKTVTFWDEFRGEGGGLGHYEIAAVGIADYTSVTLTDVTEKAEAAEAAAERRERLTGLNAALIHARSPRNVVDAVLAHVVPLVAADGALIHSLTGPEPEVAGSYGYPPEFLEKIATHRWPELMGATAVADARIQFVGSPDALHERWPHLVPLARMGRKKAWAVIPLVTADAQVGSLVLSWDAPRVFDADTEALLGTIAVALARAAEYEEARARVERLQRDLVPGRLPALTAVAVAAQYRTATGTGLGGDWYDAIRLPGGRTLAAVGDVSGYGADEPSVMGILRQAITAIAALDLPPDEILAHLNDVALRLGSQTLDPVRATVLLALYDPTTGVVSIASAGHPPPLLMTPGRPPTVLDVSIGAPLGLPHVPPETTDVTLAAGTLLALYTDGLLGADPDPARLGAVITRHAATAPPPADPAQRTAWLGDLCDTAMTTLLPETRADDAALLALVADRVPAEHIASWDMPREPESAPTARAAVDDHLAHWELDDLAWPIDQVISELVGNSVRHAAGIGVSASDPAAGDIRVRLLRLEDELIVEVYDGSEAAPHVRHPAYDQEFGRGLPIVSFLSNRWGARHTGSRDPDVDDSARRNASKCVWAAFALGTGD
ncbi:SpoIIE family protein phosphatase [Spirillospora sp. CA-128828]|uniref:SpoIIE family protein phosphatase n=1 Tax=Spirillospora sp. CA-128828 TaxID=3240033 RepID=UPI003D8C0307